MKKKLVNENTYDNSFIKLVTKKFRKFHVVVLQNNGKEMYKKVCCASKLVFFWLIGPIVVFYRSPALPSPLSITRFYILFEETINTIESFAFSPG